MADKQKCNHAYSKTMDQEYPRKCIHCGEQEAAMANKKNENPLTITDQDLYIAKHLYYGGEVRVRDNKDDHFKIHWFENIGGDGFYTTENQGHPARYISLDGNTWLDFETIKPFLAMLKVNE